MEIWQDGTVVEVFTLLVPCNRDHQWVRSCFESVRLNAPKLDFEILIVVNNASTVTKETIAKLRDEILPKARILDSGQGTLSDALNFGLLNASFEYIVRLDSDDELCEGRIEAQIDLLELCPDISVVGTAVRTISGEGNLGTIVRFPVDASQISATIKYGNCLSHPTATFRKSIAMQAGMYSNDYPHAEDYDLWLKISEISKITNLPIIGINYRVHGSQISQTNVSEQITSTRKLAVKAITKSLASRGIMLSETQLSHFVKPKMIRFRSKELRAEKARFEFAQFVAFRNTFTYPTKFSRILTIFLNNPNILIAKFAGKVFDLLRGKDET
jgi:glycosyltransferase involved in cell wall biosynthesis